MKDETVEPAAYHHARRERERRLAMRATDMRARQAHLALAQLHDIRLLLHYLPAPTD